MVANSLAYYGVDKNPDATLEDQLKRYWELLGHEGLGYTEIRGISKLKTNRSVFVDNYTDFSGLIMQLAHPERNVFVGINPRSTKSGKAEDVSYLCNFVLDLDEPKIKLTQDEKSPDYIINSGRGYHIYFPLIPVRVKNNLAELTSISKSYTENRRKTLSPDFKVDHVFDLARVMRCPGTYNTKNGSIAKFLDLTKPIKRIPLEDLILKSKPVSPVSIETSNIELTFDHIQERFSSIRAKLYINSSYPSNSEKVFHIVKQLINFGFTQEEINLIVEHENYGTPGKSYFNDIQRIFEKVEESLQIKPINLFWESYEKNLNHRELGFFTGIPKLDSFTGGFMRRELVIVGARPSVGKTTFLLNLIDEFLQRKNKVLMFPTEMNFTPLIDKLVSMRAGIPLTLFRNNELTQQDLDKIKDVRKDIKDSSFSVSEIASPNLTEIVTLVDRIRPDIVILDYFNRVSVRGVGDDRRVSLEDFVRRLKSIAKEFNCSMIVASQLNRTGDEKMPSNTSLRDTDVLEQEADVLIMLGVEDRMQTERLLHCTIGKNRHGELGYIPLKFNVKCGVIKEK